MPAINRLDERRVQADLVAFDREGHPVVIVAAEEKRPASYFEADTLLLFRWIKPYIPFAILAYADETTIYRKERDRTLTPVAKVPTREIYRYYHDGRSAEGRYPKISIIGTIDAWFRDLMWSMREEEPFESNLTRAIGLAERLREGRSKREVRVAYLPLPRNELPPELRFGEESGDGEPPLQSAPIHPIRHP